MYKLNILVITIINNCILCTTALELLSSNSLERSKRFLVFPPTAPTRVQFIGGIGIPVEDLNFESVTSGYVLKAEYFLPTMAEEWRPDTIKPQTIHRRSIQSNFNYNNSSNNAIHQEYYAYNNSIMNMYNNDDDDDNDDGEADAYSAHTNTPNTSFDNNFKSQQTNASIYRWIIYKGIETILNSSGRPGHVCLLRSICEHAAWPLHYESGLLAEILHIILTPSTSHDAELAHGSGKAYLLAEQLGHHNGIMCAHNYGACLQSPIDQITAIFNTE